jgi:Ca-activated chloride channel family protein
MVFIALSLAALALAGCGSSAEKLNNDGNKAFGEQDYEAAMTAYQQAQGESPELAEPHYNAANTHYRQQAYDQAQQEIEQALVSDRAQEGLDQHSYYNLGNTLVQAQQYGAAIEAYKEALRLDPSDLEAKQNLELALRKLTQQQQQDQQQQDQQQQDQQQQDQQQQDQQQQDQQQQDQQQQDQQQQDQQQQDQQQDPQQAELQQGDQAGGQPQQITGLSKEQAKRLFAAAAQYTESLEQYLQQIMVFPWAPPAKDW